MKARKVLNYERGFPSMTGRFVCFNCRKCFHKLNRVSCECPECKSAMTNIGAHFRTPKQSDTKRWNILEKLIRGGLRFYIYGAGKLPKNNKEVKQYQQLKATGHRDYGGEYGKNGRRVSFNAKPLFETR